MNIYSFCKHVDVWNTFSNEIILWKPTRRGWRSNIIQFHTKSLGLEETLFPPICLVHTVQLVQRHRRGLCQRGSTSFLLQSKNMHITLIETKLPPNWVHSRRDTLSSLLKSVSTNCNGKLLLAPFVSEKCPLFRNNFCLLWHRLF